MVKNSYASQFLKGKKHKNSKRFGIIFIMDQNKNQGRQKLKDKKKLNE